MRTVFTDKKFKAPYKGYLSEQVKKAPKPKPVINEVVVKVPKKKAKPKVKKISVFKKYGKKAKVK